jgi:hypothetical protein
MRIVDNKRKSVGYRVWNSSPEQLIRVVYYIGEGKFVGRGVNGEYEEIKDWNLWQ